METIDIFTVMSACNNRHIRYENYLGEIVLGKIIATRPIMQIPDDFFVYIEDNHPDFNDKEDMFPNGQMFKYTEIRRFSEIQLLD